mmetsp:Transcript_130615/g.227094  ORF Transcript_130615/g.227094 Transcript_130615/m.227094 type:complete len:211 (-) Transcript_130615:1655-2287(-)
MFQLLLERAEDHLALRWLETIHDRRNRSVHIVLCKLHQLLVDELMIAKGLFGVVNMCPFFVAVYPLFAVISSLLIERKVDALAIPLTCPPETELMVLDVFEILLGLFGGACAQALVVLVFPAAAIVVCGRLPLFIFCQCEEGSFVSSFRILASTLPDLDDWRHKLFQKPRHLHQGRPPMVYEIDHEAFDVRAVMVLVSHQHDRTIAKFAC